MDLLDREGAAAASLSSASVSISPQDPTPPVEPAEPSLPSTGGASELPDSKEVASIEGEDGLGGKQVGGEEKKLHWGGAEPPAAAQAKARMAMCGLVRLSC